MNIIEESFVFGESFFSNGRQLRAQRFRQRKAVENGRRKKPVTMKRGISPCTRKGR